mgnify:FL=1|tara:strand:+ start:179 stop:1042 length:864 start_codon:yes stop_codon:yes gene_type:complete
MNHSTNEFYAQIEQTLEGVRQRDFLGHSPNQMHEILYFPFEEKSVVKINNLEAKAYTISPIFNTVRYLMCLLNNPKGIKLTPKGNLPVKIVKQIYEQSFMPDENVDSGIVKLYQEEKSPIIHLAHILLNNSSFSKHRKGVLTLTKKGEKALLNSSDLFNSLLKLYTLHINWGYFDRFSSENTGQLGFAFSIILLNNFGHKPQTDLFYCKKYYQAFPLLLEEFDAEFVRKEHYAFFCFRQRTIEGFFELFGLVAPQNKKDFFEFNPVLASSFFYDLFSCEYPVPHELN